MIINTWLWNDKNIQNDLLILQKKFKVLNYDLTLEEVYNVWYKYSEDCHANWLNVNEDISGSAKIIEYVLNREKYLERSRLILKNNPCVVEKTCFYGIFSDQEPEHCLECHEYFNYSPIDDCD